MKNKFCTSLYALVAGSALVFGYMQPVWAGGEDDIWGGGETSWSDKVQDPGRGGTQLVGIEKTFDNVKEAYGDTQWGGLATNILGRTISSLQSRQQSASNQSDQSRNRYQKLSDRLSSLEKRNGGAYGEAHGLENELVELQQNLYDKLTAADSELSSLMSEVAKQCAGSTPPVISHVLDSKTTAKTGSALSSDFVRGVAACQAAGKISSDVDERIAAASGKYIEAAQNYENYQNTEQGKEIQTAIDDLKKLSGDNGEVEQAHKEYTDDADALDAITAQVREAQKTLINGLTAEQKSDLTKSFTGYDWDSLNSQLTGSGDKSELQKKFNSIAQKTGLNSKYFDLSTSVGQTRALDFYANLTGDAPAFGAN